MQPTLTIDSASFRAFADELARRKKWTQAQLLMRLGRQFVRYLMSVTPPFGKQPIKEFERSSLVQKRIGENAVRSDIRRLFLPLDTLQLAGSDKKLGRDIRRLVRKGEFQVLSQVLNRIGLKNAGAQRYATLATHQKKRFRGVIHDRQLPIIVTKKLGITAVIKEKLKSVGKAKAGWLKAAAFVGFRNVPAWVRRHPVKDGQVIDNTKAIRNPSITFINNANGAKPRQESIIRSVQHVMLGALKKEIAALNSKGIR